MPLILNDGASSYLYGPGGVPFEQITTAGVATYMHADQLGSIRMITNTTANNAGTASYTAYGTRTTTGTTSPFGYAGQYTDTETGLQWDRARYYDPTTAQFLTVDPFAALTGARYSYASGNPITGADPTGLFDINWGAVGVGALVVVAVVGTVACIIAEPCGLAEGGVALGSGESLIVVDATAEAATVAAAEDSAILTEGVAEAACPLTAETAGGDINAARFAQKSFSETFSKGGTFAGQSIDDVAGQLGSGALSPMDVPINVVVRGGNTLITNTRSAQALIRAGIPRGSWNVVDQTGNSLYENLLSGQLSRNALPSSGFEFP
jgi:RHS repeat-associated protein